jgi:phosphoglycolate phosphatase
MKLRHYGLRDHFRFGGFCDRCVDRAELIAQAVSSARREAGRVSTVFVIGDTPHDVKAARDNNVIAVGVATGTASEDELAAAGAHLVLRTLEGAEDRLMPRLVYPLTST